MPPDAAGGRSFVEQLAGYVAFGVIAVIQALGEHVIPHLQQL
jgi:hypothetical protein